MPCSPPAVPCPDDPEPGSDSPHGDVKNLAGLCRRAVSHDERHHECVPCLHWPLVRGLLLARSRKHERYGSFRRRMVRLGHISFFGLGFLNLLFALSVGVLTLPPAHVQVASLSFIAGAVTMPLCCFLTAWHPPLRRLFPVPVVAVAAGILTLLLGWSA